MTAGASTSPKHHLPAGHGKHFEQVGCRQVLAQIVAQHLRSGEERHRQQHPHARQSPRSQVHRRATDDDCSMTPRDNHNPDQHQPDARVTYWPALIRFFQNTATAGWPEGRNTNGGRAAFFGSPRRLPIARARRGDPFGQFAREFKGGFLKSDVGMNHPQIVQPDDPPEPDRGRSGIACSSPQNTAPPPAGTATANTAAAPIPKPGST